MPQKKKKAPARSKRTHDEIRQEVYDILSHESHKIMVENNTRENGIIKRVNALEVAGVPQSELEFIKTAISQIRYKQHQHQKAMEGLLQFFNITKSFFEEPK